MEQGVNNLSVTIHAGGPASPDVALCTAIGLAGGDNAPDWVYFLPAGTIRTADSRGPYRYADAARLIGTSLAADERLVIDENHSTDLAARKGLRALAVGWVVELQARADGIWGKVEWTEAGKHLGASRAYRGLSPVISHDRAGNIEAPLRASPRSVPNNSFEPERLIKSGSKPRFLKIRKYCAPAFFGNAEVGFPDLESYRPPWSHATSWIKVLFKNLECDHDRNAFCHPARAAPEDCG